MPLATRFSKEGPYPFLERVTRVSEKGKQQLKIVALLGVSWIKRVSWTLKGRKLLVKAKNDRDENGRLKGYAPFFIIVDST